MAQTNLIWAGLNADVHGAAASLPATIVVMGSHRCGLFGFYGTDVYFNFLMGKRVRAFGVMLMLLVFIRLKISKSWGSARALRFRVCVLVAQ